LIVLAFQACEGRSLLTCPYVWIGTVGEIQAAMAEHRRRWGITRYVVRDSRLDAADQVLAHLAHHA
jgi:hypothetical protein